jgi:lipoyl(octanoyl) transferase
LGLLSALPFFRVSAINPMSLEILPTRSGSAAENMALDFLLLQRYPRANAARFRHYGWQRPAFTFGYSQKIAFVRSQLPAGETFDLTRRPTGGGLVDHRDDWTYCLVIPRGHPLEELRATHSYHVVHECVGAALRVQGVPAISQPATAEPPATPGLGVCFQQAEPYDIVHAQTGAKIAGAAQKRNKRGLLFQGSIWRPAVGSTVDWDKFQFDFTTGLGVALNLPAESMPWPELNEDEISGLVEQYSSPEWIEYR